MGLPPTGMPNACWISISYCRGTAPRSVSVKIVSTAAAQQLHNLTVQKIAFEKSAVVESHSRSSEMALFDGPFIDITNDGSMSPSLFRLKIWSWTEHYQQPDEQAFHNV